ncbi:MAG: hypothetical protein M1812_000331 [Candelaria pacifica]|nr:MAG: hypothetical protein M1812_000331 [Candelaria pacifica]
MTVNRFGLTEVYCPNEPEVDVVLVHGLNGDPHDTWTSKKPDVFWPEQLLPQNVKKEQARVLVYGYDADVTSFMGGTSKDKIHNHAENLVAKLYANRSTEDATERPIIFVCHSLGGIVLKRALIYSRGLRNQKTEHLRSIYVSTFAILFLGTPHTGADIAKWGSMLQSVCKIALPKTFFDTSPQLIEALKTENETLQNISRQFTDIMSRFHIYFFHEAKPTKAIGDFIVDEISAAPTMDGVERMGIEADHSHMCKFETKTSPGYAEVAEGIKRYAREAPSTIAKRWPQEQKARLLERKAEAEELFPSSMTEQPDADGTPKTVSTETFSRDQSTTSLPLQEPKALGTVEPTTVVSIDPATSIHQSEPLFIVPPGLRPNSLFIGMKEELRDLNRRLFDRKKRAVGTACVLLWCLTGGGKSHLAREYVFSHRERFPGGVFWVYAKSREELWKGFWEIAQAAALKDVKDPRDAIYQADAAAFIETVKKWFENREEWLLVFDGVTIDRDDDVADLQKFIPDSKNSSIVFTSIDRTLVRKQRLLYPVAVKVRPLSDTDARALLFKELGISNATPEQRRKALDLVNSVGCLPLAIHATGHRLRATGEPLIKYRIKHAPDPKLAKPYQEIMDDLHRLRHYEARDLINLLCFFGQHVPAEMIQLGLKALKRRDVEVREKDDGARPDINTTYATLIRYALIERNDSDDDDRSQSSKDSLVKTIDMLKIHSVVQAVCSDALKASGQLYRWLGHAVFFFCGSFDAADARIKSKEGPGLVTDYREYEVHGARLMSHFQRGETTNMDYRESRAELQKTIERIREEIQKRTPASSQESFFGQASIFDRTSSASDTAPDTPTRPTHRSSTLSTFGIEFDKPQVDSPTSIRTHSPHPRIADYGPDYPLAPLYPEDVGYDTDAGVYPRSAWMTPTISDSTERPIDSLVEKEDKQWQQVTKKKPAKNRETRKDDHKAAGASKERRRRDLGAFRPILPTASITPKNVTGSVSRPHAPLAGFVTANSDAISSLSAVHSRSPPPSRGGGYISERKQSSRPRTPNPPSRSYAAALTGAPAEASMPYDSSIPQLEGTAVSPVRGRAMVRNSSQESLRSKRSGYTPSPLTASVTAQTQSTQSAPIEQSPFRPPPVSESPQYVLQPSQPHRNYDNSSDPSLPRHTAFFFNTENQDPLIRRPLLQGRNPAPLPIEENIPISVNVKRPLPTEFRGHGRFENPTHNQAFNSSLHNSPFGAYSSSDSQFPAPELMGYTSQPMSRDASGQSNQFSVADTEPARPPPRFSPLPPSPRDRFPDGGPPHKSPKFDFATTAVPAEQSSYHGAGDFVRPASADQTLFGTGHWAGQPTSPAAMTMSRSASGPGIALPEAGSNDTVAFVQFGEQEPIVLSEARQRAIEHQNRLRAFEAGAYRRKADYSEPRRSVQPYPHFDIMPVGNDTQSDYQGRQRGFSKPLEPEVHGLGLSYESTPERR